MRAIRITFTGARAGMPASPEVLSQNVRQAAAEAQVPLEHVWSGTVSGSCHAIVFLKLPEHAATIAATRIAYLVGARMRLSSTTVAWLAGSGPFDHPDPGRPGCRTDPMS